MRVARKEWLGSFALWSHLPVQDGLLEDCKELQAGTFPLVEQLLIQSFNLSLEVCYLEKGEKSCFPPRDKCHSISYFQAAVFLFFI